jgi:hypothetical protein
MRLQILGESRWKELRCKYITVKNISDEESRWKELRCNYITVKNISDEESRWKELRIWTIKNIVNTGTVTYK